MAQQYPPNIMPPELVASREAALQRSRAAGWNILPLKKKYKGMSSAKAMPSKSSNSGKAGRKYRSFVRGHGGGQLSHEEKVRRVAESEASRRNQMPKFVR